MEKIDSVFHEVVVATADASIDRPCLIIANGKQNPYFVKLAGLQIAQQYSRPNALFPGQRLTGLAVQLSNTNGKVRLGQRLFAGSIISKNNVMPVPLSHFGIQSLLARTLCWSGSVPAPFGIAVWLNDTLTDTDIFQLTATLES